MYFPAFPCSSARADLLIWTELHADAHITPLDRPVVLAPETTSLAAQSPLATKLDLCLDETALEAKRSSLRRMIRDAKKRKRLANKDVPSKEAEHVATHQQRLDDAKSSLQESAALVVTLENFQVIIAEQLQTLRRENRARERGIRRAKAAMRRAIAQSSASHASNLAQHEIDILEEKLQEVK